MSNFLNNIHPLLRRKKGEGELENTNYAILNAIDTILKDAEQETIAARDYSSLKRATGEYLEEWGQWFGIYRKTDEETDDVLRARIIEALDIPRGTNQSIKLAIRRYLEDPTVGIEIYEPWRDIFYLNRSKLNSSANLMGDYYRFAVINISIGVPFPEDIIKVIDDFKPAGVEVHVTYDPSLPRVGGAIDDKLITRIRKLLPYPSETTLDRLTGLLQEVGGIIQLTDSDADKAVFETNDSNISSTNVLTGSFTQTRPTYHLASKGQNFLPTLQSMMSDVQRATTELPEEFYEGTRELGAPAGTVAVNDSVQVYFTLNVDQYMMNKYYASAIQAERTREGYAKLLGSPEITIALSGSTTGRTYNVQVFSFDTNKWVTVYTSLIDPIPTKVNIGIGDALKYVNDNRNVFVRIQTNGAYDLAIDYFSLDYRTTYSSLPYILPVTR